MKYILLTIILLISFSQSIYSADNIKILKRIDWNAPTYIRNYYKANFAELIGKNYDTLELKLKVDAINKEIFNGGQFTSNLTYEIVNLSPNEVAIKLNFKLSDINLFSFSGNKIFSSIELKSKVQEKVRNELGKVDLEQIKQSIIDAYDDIGFFDTQIVSYYHVGKNKYGVNVTTNYFSIEEGSKKKIAKLEFRGNQSFDKNKLSNLFDQSASPLSAEGFYDKEYAENFPNILKKKYLAEGFVYVEISRPRVSYNDNDDVEIEYLVNEKSQIFLNEIKLENIPDGIESEVKADLVNQEKKPLNITELENDFKKIILKLQMHGYYFVSISNLNGDNLLTYDTVTNSAKLNINLNLERKVCFNDVVVNGNTETKSIVLSREIKLKKGEIVTPEVIETARQRLTGLGLFSSIRVTPYMIYEEQKNNDCAKTNIIIQVKEKEFGTGEFTPGYRTDLGAKLALGINYNNIGNMNRTFSFKAQANQRFNLDSLDDRRRLDDKKLLEYSGKLTFIEPYLLYGVFDSQVEFEATGSIQRKRFFSFDADIYKISPQISTSFANNISTSVRWQLERIIQFDASDEKDNDNFTIGSITPSITLDKRNDAVNPRKGFYLNLSSEWANRYFGSMRDSTFEVNYVKVISRNRFYVPWGNFVFATSVATGFEKNYAEGYYIPSIKVFRLDGFDEIRGYEDGEINRIPDGTLISEKEVKDKAYFVAFKFEPRYNLTDSMQLDVFFDAGRVFVDKFQPLDLRTSVGAGFKFLTPVGSLDFDYGIKINKRSYSDQKRDSSGRFHLSIGFF